MTSQPLTTSDAGPLVTLHEAHAEQLRAFMERDIPLNLFALSWLENHGISATRPGVFHFRGIFDDRGELEAMALVITNRLLLIDARRPELARYIGTWYCEAAFHFQHIVSSASNVHPFWESYVQASYHTGGEPIRARLISPQEMYVIHRQRWMQRLQNAHRHVPSTNLREARLSDLDAVFLASARMHMEETLEDPLETNASVFRNHVSNRIQTGRTFVWFDDHRRLLFKADISAQSRYGVQISGVYTAPQFRGQGIATRAMIDLCRALFARGWPRMTLYVNQQNAAALRVYERVGFTFYDDYETIFVAP